MTLAIFVVALMTAAATGSGAMILKLLRVWEGSPLPERTAISFTIGMGVMGWAGFFLALSGALSTAAMFALLVVMVPGLLFLRTGNYVFTAPNLWGRILLACLGLVLFSYLLEGLSPPADADTLAYHFALPKLFLNEGKLSFVPRATDGAIPLLQQMTYMVALAAGGEQALTFWTMVSGWGAAALVFCIARRHLSMNESLLTALIFLTTPAVIYGAGSGQVEVRNAMFVLIAAFAGTEAYRTGLLRYALMAGLAAGFFVASKYTGLIFAGVLGLTLLAQRRWFSMSAAYGLALIVAGGQWYAWNWWNTGDPVFPMLYGFLEYGEGVPWNQAQNTAYSGIGMATEKAVPATLLWMLLYPFMATISSLPQFESLRTGLGPFVLLFLPIALAGAWVQRDEIHKSPLFLFALTAFGAYAIWFLFGTSQRIRHFLPLYPLLLIPLAVAIRSGIENYGWMFKPAVVTCSAVLLIQFGGLGLFTINYARHAFSGESRSSFLSRNISGYSAVKWINKNLSGQDRTLVTSRNLIYLMETPVFYAHPINQAVVELRPGLNDPGRLWRQLRSARVTHILYPSPDTKHSPYGPLIAQGCLTHLKRFQVTTLASRTLPDLRSLETEWTLLRLQQGECGLSLG